MNSNSIKKLVSTPQGVLALVIIAAIVIYFARPFFKTAKEAVGSRAEQTALQLSGQKKTFGDSEYESMANKIANAINGLGTDEEAIYDVFERLENDLDFVALDKAFGVRDGENMREWIVGDLDSEELQRVNEILSTSGISKRI